MMAIVNTKACPFCGYNDVKASFEKCTLGGLIGVCSCNICGAQVFGLGVLGVDRNSPPDDIIADAMEAWNRRRPPICTDEDSEC